MAGVNWPEQAEHEHMNTKKSNLWKPGESGNPRGRPRGVSKAQQLREAIAKDAPAIIEVLRGQALAGDVQAAKVLLERALPALKPVELPHALALPDGASLTDKGHAILAAAGAGELAPGQAAALLTAVGTLARVIEATELEARIKALEDARNDSNP